MPEGPFGGPRPFGLGPLSKTGGNIVQRELGIPSDQRVEVHFHSSGDMRELRNEEVAMFITSPPYNIGWDYGSFNDQADYTGEFLPLLARVFNEAYDKLMPGGRLAVNVPTIDKVSNTGETTMAGGIPVAADIIDMMVPVEGEEESDPTIRKMQEETDWEYDHHIIWDKGVGGADAPLGSLPRPWGVLLNINHESIVVFRKPGNRDFSDIPQRLIDASKLDKGFFTGEARDDIWTINPVGFVEFNGEMVPRFPDEIPRRLVKLFTYKGDIIGDPFVGGGTTLKVAKEEDRLGVGYELREEIRPLIEDTVGESV